MGGGQRGPSARLSRPGRSRPGPPGASGAALAAAPGDGTSRGAGGGPRSAPTERQRPGSRRPSRRQQVPGRALGTEREEQRGRASAAAPRDEEEEEDGSRAAPPPARRLAGETGPRCPGVTARKRPVLRFAQPRRPSPPSRGAVPGRRRFLRGGAVPVAAPPPPPAAGACAPHSPARFPRSRNRLAPARPAATPPARAQTPSHRRPPIAEEVGLSAHVTRRRRSAPIASRRGARRVLMQSESKKYEEEIPSLLWGLDPVFSAFARLYIKDIKEMRESKQVPGIFFYNGHPVRQVDVVGMVVQTKEREAFHSYGVDDSTGVINCICWKNPVVAERSLSDYPSTPSSLKVLEQMKKFQEMVSQKTKLEIGDVIRVRGYIRTFRQQREIQSSCFYKVDDPVCDVQISRMLELPCLYREVYDKPFQSPGAGQSGPEGLDFLVQTLHEKVRDFLLENKIQTFYQQELETIHSLVSLADGPKSSPNCQVNSGSESSSKRIHSVFKEAIKKLQEKGVVFQKPSTSKDLYYHVTDHDKELLKVTLDVIKEDCQKPRHAEKGCHFLHILSCVQQSYNPNLTEVVMQRVLELLESNSDIVSTMEGYYMAF